MGCGDVETETHVVGVCGLFNPDTQVFLQQMEDVHEGAQRWLPSKIVKTCINPDREEARIVAH